MRKFLKNRLGSVVVFLLLFVHCWALGYAEPPVKSHKFLAVGDAINRAVREGQIPGAVVLIGHKGEVVYRKAYGMRSLEPKRAPMTVETIFDMASLTKVLVTTSSVMRMVEEGQIRLNDPVAKF